MFGRYSRIKKHTELQLKEYSRPSVNFFMLIGLASIIATAGLLLDNTAIVIGAMVVAPLITPIFGFSLAVLIGKWRRMLTSLVMLVYGTVLTLVIAFLTAYIVHFLEGPLVLTDEIIARTTPHFLYVIVAFASGIAGAYTYTKKESVSAVAGIAITVAVLPPLSVAGIGLVLQNMIVVQASLLLYTFNLAGIAFGSIATFIALGFGKE